MLPELTVPAKGKGRHAPGDCAAVKQLRQDDGDWLIL
jgi:hypothetical protein